MMKKSNTPGSSGGRGSLRDWASKSWGQDGRAASALTENGQSKLGYTNARGVTDHIDEAKKFVRGRTHKG
jgi:hypothetical protein